MKSALTLLTAQSRRWHLINPERLGATLLRTYGYDEATALPEQEQRQSRYKTLDRCGDGKLSRDGFVNRATRAHTAK